MMEPRSGNVGKSRPEVWRGPNWRSGARLWSKTQPQRVGRMKPLGSCPAPPAFELLRLVVRTQPRSIRRFDPRLGSHPPGVFYSRAGDYARATATGSVPVVSGPLPTLKQNGSWSQDFDRMN